MSDRLNALRRIEAVQSEMIKLAEWRLAAAIQACRELEETRTRLSEYAAGDGALSATLAEATFRSLQGIDRRRAAAERERAAQREKLDVLLRRGRALDNATRQAAETARREDEARSLAETMDAWFAARSA